MPDTKLVWDNGLIVTAGAHLPRIHGVGKRGRAGKASVSPLDATEFSSFSSFSNHALALDSEGVVLNADINVFFVDARHLNLQNNVVLIFADVAPAVRRRCLSTPPPELRCCTTHGNNGSCGLCGLALRKVPGEFPKPVNSVMT
jgi:hypothetical protein